MKIGLNATCLNDRPSGATQRFVGIYGQLVKRLPDAEFVVYEPRDCRVGDWFHGAPNVSVRRTPLPSVGRAGRLLGGLGYWGTALARERFDVFECFNQPLVKAPTGRTLLTIHDIRSIHAEWGGINRAAYRMAHRKAVRAADHVITVSNSMKQEILGFFPGAPISTIYNGVDARQFETVSDRELAAVRRRYALPQEFLLCVGHLEARKNYLRLIEAMARLRDRWRPCSLWIIGNDNGERKAIQERIASAGLGASVRLLSGLSDLEIRCFYKLCSVFVFPSSYEGFGIPILEAMAAGRPMILSDIPVFREITESKGIYFSHDDAEAMTSAIERVLSSGSECERLVQYGKERVRVFSFESLAAQVEGVYRAVTT